MVKSLPANAGDVRSVPGSEDPLEEEMATLPVFLLGKSHGQRSLEGYSPWGRKEWGMAEQLSKHVHTQTNILAL